MLTVFITDWAVWTTFISVLVRVPSTQEKAYYEEVAQAMTEAEVHDQSSGEPVGSVGSFHLESRGLRIPSPRAGEDKSQLSRQAERELIILPSSTFCSICSIQAFD